MDINPATRRHSWWLITGALLLALGACAPQPGKPAGSSAAPDTASQKTFTSAEYGFRITYPADLKLRRGFKGSYLANGHWRTYAGPDSPAGQPLVALVMPKSNKVTDGELRIGVSRRPNALKTCAQLPSAARPDSKSKTTIAGVTFTTFKAADAAMSHYLKVRGYRALHHGTCYAIDVLVYGTNPQVYAPPATAPFSKKQVFKRLVPVVQSLEFIASSNSAIAQSPIAPPATYTGLLPCADCPGIDYHLNLLADHSYALGLNYRDRHAHFDEHGRWRLADDGQTLILEHENGHPQQWSIKDGGQTLGMLDRSGRSPQSGLNYDLKRGSRFEPLD